jgi:hypothetical protein
VYVQASKQEHGTESYLASSIYLQLPDHGNGHAKNDEIANERENTIRHADGNQCVRDAASWLSFIPEIGDGRALEHVAQKS